MVIMIIYHLKNLRKCLDFSLLIVKLYTFNDLKQFISLRETINPIEMTSDNKTE